MKSVKWMERAKMRIFGQYRRILVKTKSILCNIKTQKEVPKPLGSSFRVNEVEAIVRKGRKEPPYAIQTTFSKNHVDIMRIIEEKITKASDSNLSQNEVIATYINGQTELS